MENQNSPVPVSVDELTNLLMDKLSAKLDSVVAAKKEVIDAPQKENVDSISKEVEFFRALFVGDMAVLKDLSTATGSAGGFTVPSEFYGRVIEKRKNILALRNVVTVVPMGAKTEQIATEANDMSIEWPGENTAASGADVTFGDGSITAHRMIALGKLSRELVEDSGVDILDYLAGVYARAATLEEDRVIINGSGTGQPKGIRQHSLTTSYSQTGANLLYQELLELWYALAPQYRTDSVFLTSSVGAKALSAIKDTANRPVLIPSPDMKGLQSIFGRPVFETTVVPSNLGASGATATEIWLFSPTFYTLGERQELGVEYSTEAGTAFAAHQGWLKVFKRIGGGIAQTEAFKFIDAVK